ncbi:PilZ domain-containing protein [Ponticaulis koreensis]|uniref:PilZ domain-containing protein n=1 Tax=Ponticaulis koreensis TaxID=1123045 RepID=UPI0003B52AE8|nr:PilZ domain-containing protein [Ponticaulis koreensis]
MTQNIILSPPGSAVTVRKRDRRLNVRVKLRIPVKFMTASDVEGHGMTVNLSTSGVHFQTETRLRHGDPLVCYFKHLGRFDGQIARVSGDNVAFAFAVSDAKRDRMADQLTWLINKDRLGLEEERMAERVAASGDLTVTCEDGRTLSCNVVDMSLTGVAVKTTNERPFVGENITCGIRKGTVARWLDGGFAVEFTL